jgi:hypothetical protein
MSTEGSMGAWEKATSTLAPKTADYGAIGRAQGTGLSLVDLSTESLVELLREIVIKYNFESKIKAKNLIYDYDKFKQQTAPGTK